MKPVSEELGAVRSRTTRVAAWLASPARPRAIYAVAALIGLAAFLLVYGPGHLLGTSPHWENPQQDQRMALSGYRYFLHDSWHFPIFLNDFINIPYTKSLAYLDCIPLWALINKAIATVIPPWGDFTEHAYLGLWHALGYALQACLGVACLRALGHRSWRTGLLTAVFLLAVPTWIFRYPHSALSAHWIQLWALLLYLRTPIGPTPRRLTVAKLCQLVVASMVAPYQAVMSLAVFAASVLRSRHGRTIAAWLPLGVLTVGFATWLAGYIAAEGMAAQWGFRYESANLLSWLIPQRSGIIGSGLWIANVNGTPWQYEGYAYLGLGYLVLFAVFLRHARALRIVIPQHGFLFTVVMVFCLFSLSNHVYFASHEIFSYPIPRLLRWIPNQFRAPGRFVWVPTYVLIVFLLHWAYTYFATGWRFAIVVVLALVQVVDARGDWALQREQTRAAFAPRLRLADWRPLIHAHQAVLITPSYSCVEWENGEYLDLGAMELHWLASERALPINGTYSTRNVRNCAAEKRAWPSLTLAPTTLYIFLPPVIDLAERFRAQGAHCASFELGRVCSANAGAIRRALDAGIVRGL